MLDFLIHRVHYSNWKLQNWQTHCLCCTVQVYNTLRVEQSGENALYKWTILWEWNRVEKMPQREHSLSLLELLMHRPHYEKCKIDSLESDSIGNSEKTRKIGRRREWRKCQKQTTFSHFRIQSFYTSDPPDTLRKRWNQFLSCWKNSPDFLLLEIWDLLCLLVCKQTPQ